MRQRCVIIGAMALALTGVGLSTARGAEAKEEHEQKISLNEAPSAVRKTLKREANGEEVKSLDKEKLNGKTVYEADVKIDGRNYEIVIDEEGILQSKKLDTEENEKSESKDGREEKAGREDKDGDHGTDSKKEQKRGTDNEK